jgi:hypothetical protein
MNELIEKLNNLLGERPGLLPLLGVGLILIDLLLQIYPGPGSGWFVDSNLLLHIGALLGVIGLLLIRVLS